MLTKNQRYQLIHERHRWKTVQGFVNEMNNWGYNIQIEHITQDIDTFIDKFLKHSGRQYINAVRSGEINTRYTPTDISGGFLTPNEPKVGRTYHLSWAYKGALLKLVRIEPPFCYLDNPKHKRETLIKANLCDLRIPRGGQPH